MKYNIIAACSDLGVNVEGSELGPKVILDNIDKNLINNFIIVDKVNCVKSKDETDLKKNLFYVNDFNKNLFCKVKDAINNNNFPITIGGDHSIAIGSALASNSINKNLGIIWVDAHLDYNTFETTITGNLHGLPLAAINGICKDLTPFSNSFFNPLNTVVVGYRADEINKEDELNNTKKMGVTVFTDEDINKYGIEYIMDKAIEIANKGTNGIHISYDLDVINPKFAPGVSVPEYNGIDITTSYKVANIIHNNKDKIKSIDLVEYNPLNDIDNKTLNIALNILDKIMKD